MWALCLQGTTMLAPTCRDQPGGELHCQGWCFAPPQAHPRAVESTALCPPGEEVGSPSPGPLCWGTAATDPEQKFLIGMLWAE